MTRVFSSINAGSRLQPVIQQESAEPDLTPLLDVVFIMLVFFIVTATFVDEQGITVPPRNEQPKDLSDRESLLLQLRQNDRYYIEGKQVDFRNLRANLSRLHAQSPEAPFVIAPSPEASTERLV